MSIFFSRPKRYVRRPSHGWNPRQWASKIPFRQPGNFIEVFRALWENRDNLRYAWNILNHGVCDGCALGTTGLKDWTIEGVHLCNIRLRLLRLNTMPALNSDALADVTLLKNMRARDLRNMGRLSVPMLRHKGEAGFKRISWSEATALIADTIRRTEPDRTYFYLTSRGIPNETYYAAQKAVRAIGTNNIDNAARVCHSPSTFALKAALGVAATTCSYSDLIGTDLVTFFGSNVSNNQPVMMKYLYHAKKARTQIAVVNPYREPGMDAYWIPSDLESAMFGTRMTDHFFQVRAGGDIAFLHGVVKSMIENGWYDRNFVASHTAGFDALRTYLESLSWETLEAESGVSAVEIERYARLVKDADKAIFIWGMGITQHVCGEDNVQAIINLALLKGFVGREGCGLMPIRGHSGVQGGAEMGAYATALPGGVGVTPENVAKLSAQYGFDLPETPGMTTPHMLTAAQNGDIDVLFAVGGNFKEVMPDPRGTDKALGKIPLRVHMDITLSSQMFVDPADAVLLLPALTRYEVAGGVTETSTERRIIFSPHIEGSRMGEARSEWDVLGEVAALVRPDIADKVRFTSTQAIRDEIARVVPYYAGIETLRTEGDSVQYGGPLLCKDWQFNTTTGKANFAAPPLPQSERKQDEFVIVTRRGKQFNSIVHEDKEALNGLKRDAILINADDARRMGFFDGETALLSNKHGRYSGKLSFADIASGTIEVYWPEANVLLDPTELSPLANIPAYKSGKARLWHSTPETAIEPEIKV
jgi:molybdopterin-dependent oxidoreductase alpha subunit